MSHPVQHALTNTAACSAMFKDANLDVIMTYPALQVRSAIIVYTGTPIATSFVPDFLQNSPDKQLIHTNVLLIIKWWLQQYGKGPWKAVGVVGAASSSQSSYTSLTQPSPPLLPPTTAPSFHRQVAGFNGACCCVSIARTLYH